MNEWQVGNLYDLLGKMLADRANSVPAALRARAKKQVCPGCNKQATFDFHTAGYYE